ncbi:GTP-binding protein [Pholiota molesta]|nr:GTP-binding protein [Pholiota molesta]
MPRIRKETSNRRSTNDRAKRRKQVKESKRKAAKAAKKNPQWKSKTPKDPGIPSEFPYKDQILAEVAEQRRIAAEEKEKKKQEKQRALAKARAIARGEPFEDSEAEAEEGEGSDGELDGAGEGKVSRDLNVGAESIAALSAKSLGTHLKPRPRPAAEVVEEEDEDEEDEVPVLINRDLPNLQAVLAKADVVVEVLDARDPLAYRSKHIEETVKGMGKKVLFVLNKIDTCPREAVVQWSTQLRNEHPTLLFRSATSFLPEPVVQAVPKIKKGKGKAPKIPTTDAIGADSILSCLSHWAKEKEGDEPLAVAVVGVANVGKSSLINSLLKRSALPVYTLSSSSRGPTTTELPQEVELESEDQKMLIIDTPGLSFVHDDAADAAVLEEGRARDILLRSKGRIDRLKDPKPPVLEIVSRANVEDLMLLYSLPAFVKGDLTSFLSGVARANQLVKRKGELDLTGAARIVLRDWSVGKLSHYTLPPSSASPKSTPAEASHAESDTLLAQLYAHDEAVLAGLPTRKDRRRDGGLVRLAPARAADARHAALEQDWAGLQDSEAEASDDGAEQSAGDDDAGMDVDDEEEEDAEEGEEEGSEGSEEEGQEDDDEDEDDLPAPAPLSNKQKRKRALEAEAAPPARPAKKVAFAAALAKPSRTNAKQLASMSAQQQQISKPLKPVQASSAKAKQAKVQEKPVIAPIKTASKAKSMPPKSKSSSAIGAAPGAKKVPSAETSAKVANTPSATKAKRAEGKKEAGGAEAYDFGKFF